MEMWDKGPRSQEGTSRKRASLADMTAGGEEGGYLGASTGILAGAGQAELSVGMRVRGAEWFWTTEEEARPLWGSAPPLPLQPRPGEPSAVVRPSQLCWAWHVPIRMPYHHGH